LAINNPLVEYPERSIKKSKAITKNRKIGDGKSERHTVKLKTFLFL